MNEKMYFALRNEIGDNQKQESTVIIFAYTSVATILGIAFNSNNKWVAMLSVIMIIPISYRISRIRDAIAYIAAYINVFVEPELEINWETDHNKFRSKYKISKSYLYKISRADFVILSIISIASFWILNGIKLINKSISETILIISIQLICLILVIIQFKRFSNVDVLKAEKIKKWKDRDGNNYLSIYISFIIYFFF